MDKFEQLLMFDKLIFDIYGKVQTLKRTQIVRKNRSKLEKNRNLPKLRTTNKCYVIGLGPSLKSIDLAKLDGDIIVTNRFYKVAGALQVKPTLYVMCDNDFFTEKHINDFKSAVERFPDTTFVLNGLYIEKVEATFSNRKDFNYLFIWNGFLKGGKDELDCSKVLPMSSNVICTALYIALYMGYKEIFLLGCDFNSFASPKAIHVYEEKNNERLWTMSNELFQYSFAADLHCQLNTYAIRHGQTILNATDGSLIDAYPKIKLPSNYYKKEGI